MKGLKVSNIKLLLLLLFLLFVNNVNGREKQRQENNNNSNTNNNNYYNNTSPDRIRVKPHNNSQQRINADSQSSKKSQQQQQQQQQFGSHDEKIQITEFGKGKICIGTNGRMSVPSNRFQHYRNLRDRYTNCTYVDGNLELTWLQDQSFNLTFLQHIREVTGYVLISHVDIQNIILPKLQIIRGRTLFKINILDEPFSLFVSYSQMLTLEMPALRDILAGSVAIFNNYNLCHIRSINWDEIISGSNASMKYNYDFMSPERKCPDCHADCERGCWGEGEHNCQKFSKTNCSPQCAGGRCFGTQPRQCCHLFCAGGCTGPTQRDCIACKNFYDDGTCKQECPPMQRYNPTNYLWEVNPEGKFAYGATCVRNCPEHLLKDSGACVRTCPADKMAKKGECVTCNGPCPKTCPGTGIIHSGNIERFKGCTIIDGSIEILDQSFDGYQQVYTNFSFGERFIKMHPDRLEIFHTLREVTGYILIQGYNADFKNLSYFRNLESIGGRQLMENLFASFYIVKTSLQSLELKSLKQINAGAVAILENKELCFVESIDWTKIKKNKERILINANRDRAECKKDGFICSEECTSAGCWGSSPEQCLECNNFQYNGKCLASCSSIPNIYQVDEKNCTTCDPECRNCTGPGNDKCVSCANARDDKFCVPECSDTKYNKNGVCVPCHNTCIGCTGPLNTIGKHGCKTCHKAIINGDASVERCLLKNEPCPDGYYYEWVIPQEQGPLQSLAGKGICRRCHPRCKRCTGYGFHEQVCQECTGYKRGEQCEDECPSDHYADEAARKCIPCNTECRGCIGVGSDDCIQCRNYKIFQNDGDPFDNSTSFNCTATCPETHPFKVFPPDQLGPFCSKTQQGKQEEELAFILLSEPSTIIIIIVVLLACFIVFIAMYMLVQRAKENKDAAKMTKVLTGEDSVPLKPTNVGPNLTKLRIIKEAELRRGGVLGMGAFGRVHKGVWIPEHQNYKIPVAIKVLIDMSGAESTKEFLEEAYIMASVEHPNLLKLLAVCMTNEMMLITQLMPLGCLLDYVKKNKQKIGSKAFLDWSCQIAKGMQYLEENRLVHRDLAARNVLVQTPSHIKITDFGLAKLLDCDSDEYKASGGKMPIKWLALECIRHRIFTSKSDVWAFGVTIWELLTFGCRPFADIEAKDLVIALEKGHRLQQPPICTLDIYMLLLSCWLLDANARPTFKQLYDKFMDMATDPGRYLVIEGDKFLRLPAYTSKDEKDLIRTLAPAPDDQNSAIETEEYLQPNIRSTNMTTTGSSTEQSDIMLPSHRYCSYPMKNSGDDETDSHLRSDVGLGNLTLHLPLDEDDYLMPSQNPSTNVPGYMDLIASPATCIDNPEYLIGASTNNLPIAPTQTLGIPVTPTEVEHTSDQEYYNDLQRELQPLRRNETTV